MQLKILDVQGLHSGTYLVVYEVKYAAGEVIQKVILKLDGMIVNGRLAIMLEWVWPYTLKRQASVCFLELV